MRRIYLIAGITLVVLLLLGLVILINHGRQNRSDHVAPIGIGDNILIIHLPEPDRSGTIPLETTLENRRSIRTYRDAPLSLEAVSQLLWAAQGVTDPLHGLRSAPSAGALYPLELLVVAGLVDDLPAGVYRYVPREHGLVQIKDGDQREALYAVSLSQDAIRNAPASFVITAVPGRTTATYGARGIQYVHMEVGHAGQNLSLQAVALDLGTVVIGAFNDKGVSATLGLTQEEEPCYIMPVGLLE